MLSLRNLRKSLPPSGQRIWIVTTFYGSVFLSGSCATIILFDSSSAMEALIAAISSGSSPYYMASAASRSLGLSYFFSPPNETPLPVNDSTFGFNYPPPDPEFMTWPTPPEDSPSPLSFQVFILSFSLLSNSCSSWPEKFSLCCGLAWLYYLTLLASRYTWFALRGTWVLFGFGKGNCFPWGALTI